MEGAMENESRMYKHAKTWNPFVGCEFDCTYCVSSFKAQAKRRKKACQDCYDYRPHCHPERLDVSKLQGAKETVFVSGYGDISFCPPEFTRQIIDIVRQHSARYRDIVYYFQSKRPEYFQEFLSSFPESVILLTTLETNRDEGYKEFSEAPLPSERYRQFLELDYPRKVVTVEPVMDFDLDEFLSWLLKLKPEYVWLGLNSRPKKPKLPEPDESKLRELFAVISGKGVGIRLKGDRIQEMLEDLAE
jgi:hypothetical protein